MEKFAPPPTRAAGLPERAAREVTTGERRKAWWGAKGKKWGDKAQVWSDSIGGRVNSFAENRLGSEAFYPVTGDMPREMDKVARILRMFTGEYKAVDGRGRRWRLLC
jgi:hypothetical protein